MGFPIADVSVEPVSGPLDLPDRIRRLQDYRRRHMEAITAIDQALTQIGHALGKMDNLGEELATTPDIQVTIQPTVRRKGRFAQTAEVSVLDFIRRLGAPTTAQINEHWRREGRRGTANVTVLRLLRQSRIRRQLDPSVRGSRYVLDEGGETRPSATATAVG